MHPYNQTDRQLHALCQIIAKVNRTYVQHQEDDSHTNLYFDALGQRIFGRWVHSGEHPLMLALDLQDFAYHWRNVKGKVVHAYPIADLGIDALESKIASGLSDLGLNPRGFREDLHFSIPDYPGLDDRMQPLDPAGLQQWMHYRSLANHACTNLLGYLQSESEVRIWPHHFDTGIYAPVGQEIGIGFGLAMEDDLAGAPYFYLAGYPTTGELTFENLPELGAGRWEVEDWKGAILPLTELKENSADDQLAGFMQRAADWFVG